MAALSVAILWGCSLVPVHAAGLSARVDRDTGNYEVRSTYPWWSFGGTLGQHLTSIKDAKGQDGIGAYTEIAFRWQDGVPMSGSIRCYNARPVALFTEKCLAATTRIAKGFPTFTRLPSGLHPFSYRDDNFAPFDFHANTGGTPWLLFDDRANAAIVSPASNFMVASMSGDGISKVESGFTDTLSGLPAGFTHSTLLAVGPGINATWDVWGRALTDFLGVQRPANDADVFTRCLGYWTDNGATYYYHYDPVLGYEDTLTAMRDEERAKGIPLRYFQLDSWWYRKTTVSYNGVDEGKPKVATLPRGDWNAYGGLLEYKADPFVFPDGVRGFHNHVDLPLITHNRWMDRTSPYHGKYRISGIGAVDSKWWNDIMAGLKRDGVNAYEQDWLIYIYRYSPQMSGTVWAGNAFMDGMANAAKANKMTMQYCMALPRHFLQGAKYPNLTNIRVSDDRFEKRKWEPFLFTSRLASALGEWPWVDVFMSSETDNIHLATLSAGPVGIGDAMGKENLDNIFQSVRTDGVIVKPDRPLAPTDAAYTDTLKPDPSPLVAWTETNHGPRKTVYVFALSRKAGENDAHFRPADFGLSGAVTVYNSSRDAAVRQQADETFDASMEYGGAGYYEIAPEGVSGIAFMGDNGKFVSTGRQRIAAVQESPGRLWARVLFAKGEQTVTLHGFSETAPVVSSPDGDIGGGTWDSGSHHFFFTLSPQKGRNTVQRGGEPLREVNVLLEVARKPTDR